MKCNRLAQFVYRLRTACVRLLAQNPVWRNSANIIRRNNMELLYNNIINANYVGRKTNN